MKRLLRRGRRDAVVEPPRNVRKTPRPDAVRAVAPRIPLRARLAVARERIVRFLAQRQALLRVAFRVALALVLMVGFAGLARVVERHMRTAPAFATKRIDIRGAERLSETVLLQISGLGFGQNVFVVSPEQAEDRLRAHPWIASAEVRRRLPDTFTVHVREREPKAILSLGGLYLVSDDGAVFKRVTDEDQVDLPVITGVDRERFTADRTYRTSVLLEVVALLHDYANAGLGATEPVQEVHVAHDDGLTLYVGRDATEIRLGAGPYRRKLRRLREVVSTLSARRTRALYVYLDNERSPDRVTVRLR